MRKLQINPHLFWKMLRALICLALVISPLPVGAQLSLPRTTILPATGSLLTLSPGYMPPIIQGMTLDPKNPMQFEFIINSGQDNVAGQELSREGLKMIKYFLAALTVPEDQMWVNLSPYEPDRIIPPHFGLTEMGRDMLAQDYLLKQLTASLVYPEEKIGQEFWQTIYQQVRERLGDAEVSLSTFNKVWIVPDKAVVYEHENSVFILESRLKVMLEDDYFSMLESRQRGETVDDLTPIEADEVNKMSARATREIILPAIEKEINEGKTFAGLRQIYQAMILAAWYKVNMHETILGRFYADQNKIAGIDLIDPNEPQLIYEKYLKAFQSGVFNFIREDYDALDKRVLPRKYFSGGVVLQVKKVLKKVQLSASEIFNYASEGLTVGKSRVYGFGVQLRELGGRFKESELTRAGVSLASSGRFGLNTQSEKKVFVTGATSQQLADLQVALGSEYDVRESPELLAPEEIPVSEAVVVFFASENGGSSQQLGSLRVVSQAGIPVLISGFSDPNVFSNTPNVVFAANDIRVLATQLEGMMATAVFDTTTGDVTPGDVAVNSAPSSPGVTANNVNYGGIDFNPEWLDLQIRRDGNGVPLPLSEQLLEDIQIEGVIPMILSITPIANLFSLLGLSG